MSRLKLQTILKHSLGFNCPLFSNKSRSRHYTDGCNNIVFPFEKNLCFNCKGLKRKGRPIDFDVDSR